MNLAYRRAGWLLLAIAITAVIIFAGQSGSVQAAAPAQDSGPSNAECLTCHDRPDQVVSINGNFDLFVSINPAAYGGSAHGQSNQACVACHTNISGYPHPEVTAADRRAYTLEYQETCKACHAEQYQPDSVHAQAMEAGNTNAPICADCHNPHTQKRLTGEAGQPNRLEQLRMLQSCARCHSEIFHEYADSVHGSQALVNNNPDVPTCITCHGVHQMPDPRTAQFRNSSVQLCGNCHADPVVMEKYGISTQVYSTYVADFHGTTVTLFDKTSPDEVTNKAVCYDCHGVHNIKAVDDPEKGLQVRENMLLVCQKCHPDASDNFPDSWLGHYIPDREKYPLVYYVNLFYKFFIPGVLGTMAIFVASDVFYKVRKAIGRKNKPVAPSHDDGPETSEKKEG